MNTQQVVKEESDRFWGEDLKILLEPPRIIEFFPSSDQTLEERVNAISRLIIYISIILAIYQSKSTPLYFGVGLLILVYFMWQNKTIPISPVKEYFNIEDQEYKGGTCRMPTVQNPFMNRLAMEKPGLPPACTGPGIQEQAANLLDDQLFSDVDDLFDKNANKRLFRTMPNTTGIPDTTNFSNWLIKGTDNCKDDGRCPPVEDLRRQRQLIAEDLDKEFEVSGFTL